MGLGASRTCRDVLRRDLTGFPTGKQLFQLRRQLGERRVARHHQRRVVGPEPDLVKLYQIVARDFLHAGGGARSCQRIAVSMARPIEQAGKNSQGHGNGLTLLLLNGVQLQLLLTLEVGLRKRRMEDDIGKQVEGGIELGLQRREAHKREVEIGIGLELRARARPFGR